MTQLPLSLDGYSEPCPPSPHSPSASATGGASALHKNDPGVYSTTYYNHLGRRVDHATVDGAHYALPALFSSLTEASQAADEWRSVDARHTAVVHRCIYNTQLPARWPKPDA